MKKINAVVVTYNRKNLLLECIEAILNQSYKINRLILIDNNSTDGTEEFLKEKNILSNKNVLYVKLNKNIGGAGGFYEGIKKAIEIGSDFVWIMDDDTIPVKDSLEKLINAIKIVNNEFSFFASTVYGANGEFMNVPNINTDNSENGYPNWYEFLENGIVKIKEATFVSLLINSNAIKKVGLPVKDYFIWGDDTEYTLRLNKYYGPAYFIGNSKVIHKRNISKNLSIYEEVNPNRINFYYYMIRNNLINERTYFGIFYALKTFIKWQLISIKLLFKIECKKRLKKFFIIHKALLVFMFKLYNVKNFKKRFNL